jgi:ribosomal peptide maturation radical SAM protein 1
MILRACPWIDAICDGEGEHVVAALARAAAGEAPLSSVKGIVYRSKSGCVLSTPPPPAVDLESLPPPDYSDFYADIERLSTEFMVDVAPRGLPIENSRGCWWGEKNHCVFCGIHDDDMAYRHKSAASVIQTLDTLHARHAPFAFRFADYILPNSYYTTLLPELVRRGAPYRLECELKANLKEAQVSLLSKAGFLAVQPGIESFSTPVLTAMRKGVSAAQNVFTLLMGRRYQIDIYYNLLYGFPGDEAADYATMVRQLPRLFHLGAPVTCLPVQITRFAPLHARPEAFGIERAEPEPCYDLVFSADFRATSGFDMADFAYYFERSFENAPKLQCLYADMDDIATAWRQRGPQRAWLCLKRDAASGDMRVHDGRLDAETVYAIDPALQSLLAHCRQPTPRAAVCAAAGLGAEGLTLIDRLDQLGLVFCDGDRVLSLVDDETQAAHPPHPPHPADSAHSASSAQAAEIQDYAA